VCIGTTKRGWYNDKVHSFFMFRLPQLKSVGDKFELHRFIANLIGWSPVKLSAYPQVEDNLRKYH
jgi:hypothetical protein